jgi:hypothetical protein
MFDSSPTRCGYKLKSGSGIRWITNLSVLLRELARLGQARGKYSLVLYMAKMVFQKGIKPANFTAKIGAQNFII